MDADTILRVAAALGGAYLAILWIGLLVWTYRDIRSRSQDPVVHLLALGLVVLFNLPGLLIYFILRPKETISDRYQRSLEEEALLSEIEELQACPNCKRRVSADFIICPGCRTQIKQSCPNCERALNPSWNICPYCTQEVTALTTPAQQQES
jgi:RNA polymerase subunit RPABC4/transcription elongation factor Spt4